MSKSNEQQAAEILTSMSWVAGTADMAAALSRAGLLASERDVLCRRLADAMEAYAKRHGNLPRFGYQLTEQCSELTVVIEEWEALAAYDREHAPKPRYYVEGNCVYDGNYPPPRVCVYSGPSPEHATAVAAALNALAEKEAGR